MSGNLALPVAVLFNSLDDLLVPFVRVVENALWKNRIERGPVGESLAFWNLGNMVTFMEMVRVAVNEFVITQKNLTFDIRPDGFLADPPGDELAVFSQRFSPRSAELTEHPVNSEAGVGLLLTCRGQVAGPFPLVREFHHAGSDRVQNDIPANFKKMRVFLDNNRLVSALEKMAGSMASVIEELSVDTVHLAHAKSEVPIRGLDEKMVMIVHEAVSVA